MLEALDIIVRCWVYIVVWIVCDLIVFIMCSVWLWKSDFHL